MAFIEARWFVWKARHPRLERALLPLLVVVIAAVQVVLQDASFSPLLTLAIAVPLYWRRQYPLPVFGVVMAAAIPTISHYASYSGFAAIILAVYAVGVYSRHRVVSLVVLLGTSAGVIAEFGGGLPHLPNWSGPFVVLGPPWLAGVAVHGRQLRIEALSDRAERLERERDLVTRAALAEERARIARELHDVVAHNVSVMVVQAGAARQVLTSSPDGARESLLAVEAAGRAAMTELRGLLGILRDDEECAGLAPQPGLSELDALLARVRNAGLPVTMHIQGEPRPLPAGVDLTAYRVLQEALTNALRHSGLAPTTVTIDYGAETIDLLVTDEGSVEIDQSEDHAPGSGLAGMRERVSLYGGSLVAGPQFPSGYRVQATLPLMDGPT